MSAPAGFGPGLVAFYDGLEQDNTRAWWLAHKDVYDSDVRAPLLALADALTAEFGAPKIFRPNRDVRFSKDKRPYQDFASLAVEPAGGEGTLYLQVSAEGLMLAGGYWQPAPDQLERWRRAVDDDVLAADLDRTLQPLAAAGFPLGEGNPVKTSPRGWASGHPRIDLIRRRSLTVSRAYDPGQWWETGELLSTVTGGWRHVGRSAVARHPRRPQHRPGQPLVAQPGQQPIPGPVPGETRTPHAPDHPRRTGTPR